MMLCGYNGPAKKRRDLDMQRMEKYASVVPGLLIAVAVAAAARFLEGLLPIHLIGASVIALFIGMGINALRKPSALVAGGPMFTSKRRSSWRLFCWAHR